MQDDNNNTVAPTVAPEVEESMDMDANTPVNESEMTDEEKRKKEEAGM